MATAKYLEAEKEGKNVTQLRRGSRVCWIDGCPAPSVSVNYFLDADVFVRLMEETLEA